MGQQFNSLSDKHMTFIAAQKIFFVGTAAENSRVNISPKGMDSLRVLSPNRVIWLNVTGSGNETSAHIQQTPRMTLMFCAFEGQPLILRLYGTAKVIHKNDSAWHELANVLPPITGARQYFDLHIELVQNSCGMAVPTYQYTGNRELLLTWAEKKGEQGLNDYWQEKNQASLDGIPSYIVEKNR